MDGVVCVCLGWALFTKPALLNYCEGVSLLKVGRWAVVVRVGSFEGQSTYRWRKMLPKIRPS